MSPDPGEGLDPGDGLDPGEGLGFQSVGPWVHSGEGSSG